MKTFIIILVMVCLQGCVGTMVDVKPDPLEIKVRRLAVLYWADIPQIGKDGIKGYKGGGDAETIKAAVEAAMTARLKP